MTDFQMPPELSPALIAKSTGKSRRAVIGRLEREGILERDGYRWKARPSRVLEKLPDWYQAVYSYLSAHPQEAGSARQ